METKIQKNALFLIDGSYFLYRSYFALPPLQNSHGRPTQATYAFCRTIRKLINDYNPEQLAVVWDTKGGSFRNEIFPEYKATRPAPPSDLFIQKEDILRFLELVGICNVVKSGYEADDLLSFLARKNHNSQTVIVCADKDMHQLLNDNVLIIDPFKHKIIDAQLYETEKGLPPAKIPFFYSLLGDSSDNIPGVKGIGNKTALDLITQFASLDDLYNRLDDVEKPRTRKLLEEQKENAFLSLKLFTLDQDVDLPLEQEKLRFNKQNWINAASFFEELELKSLVKDLDRDFTRQSPTREQQASIEQKTPEAQIWKCTVVTTVEQLDAMIEQLKHDKMCGLDTETTGVLPLLDKLVGISFASNNDEAFYIPLGHPISENYPQLDLEFVIEKLRPVLESPEIGKTLHYVKFDELVLWNYGINLQGVVFDSLIAANLTKKSDQKINLKDLSSRYLHESMTKFKDVMGTKYKQFSEVPIELGAEYGAHDALQTFKLKPLLEEELNQEPKLKKLFDTIEMPLYHVLTGMEKKGILFDPEKLKATTIAVEKELKQIEEKIFAALPARQQSIYAEPINLNSPKQIETLLFDELQLPVVKKSGKGSRSTDYDVLLELSKLHPIPGIIIKHRELSKLKSTYLEPLPQCINPKTGRIHTTYSQTMTATGRLSSSNPNLQNIPTSEGYGIHVRSAFVAPAGHLFLSADYSQIELRILAHLSGDKELLSVFNEDKDIHAQTAAQLFNTPLEQVTHEQRQIGKRINFSIIYGLTPFGLAQELDIKPNEAKQYIDIFFAHYHGIAEWMKETVKQATINGYVESWQGLRRYIPELHEQNRTRYELGKRLAANSPVQSTQADIIKIAMININKALSKKGLKTVLILQIHDELVFEVPEHELAEVELMVKQEMESVVQWTIPIKVTMRSGLDWGAVTK